MTNTIEAPVARAQMLIRKPVAQVVEALVDPAVTSRFWFSRGSGRLEAGKRVRWDWEMYGVSAEVEVKAVEENERIRFLLAGLKAYLEHGIELDLVADHAPDALVEGWASRREA